MITYKQARRLETQLVETEQELESLIAEYFANEPLVDIGDTAQVVRLLHLQAQLVEQLGIEKAKLRDRKRK